MHYGVVTDGDFDFILETWGAKKRKKVRGSKRKVQNEEVRNLSFSQNIMRKIKSARMRWTLKQKLLS